MTTVNLEQDSTTETNRVTPPFVSVIIPVYNDAARLQLCLTALESQSYRPDRYEIIVVDNGSDPEQQISTLVDRFDHVVITQELVPGSYIARNKGISLAQGDVIAFTDADCIPASDWLEKGVQCLLQHDKCGLVGGRISMFFKDPSHPTAVELYDYVIMDFPQEEFIQRQACITANVFTWKRVIDHVGGFGTHFKSFGDQEWGKRVHQAGYDHVYAEDACVAHPTRASMEELSNRAARITGGIVDMYITHEPSVWVRYKRFIRLILEDLTTHNFHVTQKALRDPRLDRWQDRIKVLGVAWLMQLVSIREKIRLKLGGISYR
jgi:glycosyltransferase involved in cell wall biosynthesis